jgi:hypothetical protein
MAKPIPLNRRWVQNQQARAEAAADPTAAATPVVREQAQSLGSIVGAVIPARRESPCPGCGEPIRVGDPIVRHPQWGRYVHAHCRNRQQRAAVAYTIVACYPGICRHCGQPVHPGERITQVPRLGWVHEPCAQQRQRDS